MTVRELVEWCEANNISYDTQISFDRGIDLIEESSRVVFNGMELVLIGRSYDEEV